MQCPSFARSHCFDIGWHASERTKAKATWFAETAAMTVHSTYLYADETLASRKYEANRESLKPSRAMQ